ncbi:stonin-1 [Bombina bombina]|uniref:stonin-1 n=1 Tax=Bombina bombina TaxID=8345 RepID=UPI00235AC49D|nr:stonin-1 [Bombina bombina]
MCSTNPGNWVTFEDETPFHSPQKALILSNENIYSPKSGGLRLNFSSEKLARSSSSNSTTPLPSPMTDFFMSPGPPSNSPLCTPIKECPITPCTPKLGLCNVQPPAEASGNVPFTLSSLSSSLSVNSSSNTPTTSHFDEASPPKHKSSNEVGCHSGSIHCNYLQKDCAFSSPFWNNDFPAIISTNANIKAERDEKDRIPAKTEPDTIEKETFNSQKSLNQCSFNYVCERLQNLKIDPPDNLKHLPLCTEKNSSSFIPQSLFRSQRKDGWPFMLRIPEKKNMMSSRQWGPIYLKVINGGILQMYYEKGLDKPFREVHLNQFCRVSESKLENLSVSDKIHTVKIEQVSYTEKRKYHPKLEVVHEAEIEQMLKLGTMDYCDLIDFITTVEEELLMLSPVSKPKKAYEESEMILEIIDNCWGKVTKDTKLKESSVISQLYCLCFTNSDTELFLTLNDADLQKISKNYFDKESKNNLIDILDYHFHKCVNKQEFEKSRIIKFKPIDGCRFELMRFKTNFSAEELPFSMKTAAVVQGAYVELQAFLNMSPSVIASPLNSVKYCENIAIHFPVPSQWMKALWTVSFQRQRSLKTKMNRRACLGSTYEIESEPVIQVTIGTAKYEHAYKAVVWKIDRLPDKNSSHDQPHSLSCKLELGSDQEIPHNWNPFATLQYVMPATSASGAELKSMGIENDIQPHKHVTQKTCYNIQVEIEVKRIKTEGDDLEKTGDCIIQ